jgi:large subunit ribosomal protein L3
MRLGLLAKKIGMSRFYDSSGVNHPVTILKVDESNIVDIRNAEKNGYLAVRLSLGKSKRKDNKSVKGFLKKQNVPSFLFSKEFRVSEISNYKVGQKVAVSNFIEGQFVDVTSNSKGKGFAGGMKRHNFGGNRATHGVSISHRSHGSTGQCQDPGKVFKGKKMAGRLGNVQVTIQNLKVLKVDNDNGIILVKGSVPGHKDCLIKVFDSVKKNQEINSITKDEASQTNDSMNQNEGDQVEASQTNDSVKQQTTEDKSNKSSEPGVNAGENKQGSDQNSTKEKSDKLGNETNNNEVKQ